MDEDTNDRDANGRFAAGNRCGVGFGRPASRHGRELQDVLSAEVDSACIKAVVRKLRTAAEEGDLDAIKVLFDRVLGKVQPPPDEIDIGPLPVDSIAECLASTASVLKAVTEGRVTPTDGGKLVAIVNAARSAIVEHEIVEQIAELREQIELGKPSASGGRERQPDET